MSAVIPEGRQRGDVQTAESAPQPTSGAAVAKPSNIVGSGLQRPRLIAAVVLPPVGAAVALLALHHAAGLDKPDQAQFALLWAGFLCGMLPLVALACSTGINGVTRTCALAGIGLAGTGRLLRFSAGPMGNDEFIHTRQAIETYLHGDVGHGPGIFPHFPGLHQTISAFARLTGSPLWPSALAVITLAHILSVLAVYQLVRAVGASPAGAAVGAVVYTLNPSWLYFDTSISYESLALPVLLWCLAAAVAASRAPKEPSLRYIAVVVLCAAALPMIHHLTTIMLFLILALLTVAVVVHSVRRIKGRGARQEHLWPLLLAASWLLVSSILWWSDIRNELVDYLGPSLTRGWAQLQQILRLKALVGSFGGRMPFSGAQNPIYETVCGLLFPAVVLVLFLVSLAVLWDHRSRLGSAPWGFAAVGAMFFLSIPMVLTNGGGEGAHRSWGFSFIGIAVVCGMAWSFGVPSAVVARFGPLGRGVVGCVGRPGVRIGVLGVVLTVLYVGGAALGTNISSRFPGSAHVGDDARSVSREGAAVAAWLRAHAPVDTRVVADRYTSHQVDSEGRMAPMAPSAAFPVWDLYMSAQPVRRQVLKQVLDADIRYFVVDARMSTTRPRLGFWFTGDEPGVYESRLFPQMAIDRFNCLPWLRASYAAGPLTVYEVDADVLRRTMAGSCEGRGA